MCWRRPPRCAAAAGLSPAALPRHAAAAAACYHALICMVENQCITCRPHHAQEHQGEAGDAGAVGGAVSGLRGGAWQCRGHPPLRLAGATRRSGAGGVQRQVPLGGRAAGQQRRAGYGGRQRQHRRPEARRYQSAKARADRTLEDQENIKVEIACTHNFLNVRIGETKAAGGAGRGRRRADGLRLGTERPAAAHVAQAGAHQGGSRQQQNSRGRVDRCKVTQQNSPPKKRRRRRRWRRQQGGERARSAPGANHRTACWGCACKSNGRQGR